MLEPSGKPAAELAREFEVHRNQLYTWQAQLSAKGKEDVFPGHGRRAGSEARVAQLRRENEQLNG